MEVFSPSVSLRLPDHNVISVESLQVVEESFIGSSAPRFRHHHRPSLENPIMDVFVMNNITDDFEKHLPNFTMIPTLPPDLLYRHSPGLTAMYCVAYFIVFAMGLVGNCLVVAVVFRAPRMRTVTNLFIVNLAIADILVVVLCIPATLISNVYVPWVLGWWLCKTVPYVQSVSVSASVFSLIAVSIDRFLAIWWPLKCQITKYRAKVIIISIWFVSCTCTIPLALFFDLVTDEDNPDIPFCIEVWPTTFYDSLYFLIAHLLLCYILPLIIISLCYILIWIRVWKRSIPGDTKHAQMERMQQKSKVKVIKMLVVVVIIFVVSWLPLYVIFTRVKLGGQTDPWEEKLIQLLTPVAQWMGSSNSCINPILYAFFNKKYRRGFMAIIKSKKCCGRLRYYETVGTMGSTIRSKSSYYNNNSSKRRMPGQDTTVSYIFNNTGV